MRKTEATQIKQQYVSTQLTTAISVAIIIGMISMFFLYTGSQKREILESNEKAMHLVTQSIILNLHSIMVAGYADIASDFVTSLKSIPSVTDIHITRIDGSEAFLDNLTIDDVNFHTGEDSFFPRDEESFNQVIPKDNPYLLAAKAELTTQSYYEDVGEKNYLTFIAPIENLKRCHNCHGDEDSIRGFLKVSTSMDTVYAELDQDQSNTVLIYIVTSIIIVAATLSLVFESLIFPLNTLTGTMKRVADGRLHLRAPINGNDELSEIARNFNVMIHRIEHSYVQQKQEQNKLMAIVQTNQEGVICSDESGTIILVNPSAKMLLDKKAGKLMGKPFNNCFGDPELVDSWFAIAKSLHEPKLIEYKGKLMNVSANTIHDETGKLTGRSMRFVDVTEEMEIKNRLQQLSTLDSLTGLFNRRYFDQSVGTEIERALQDNQKLALIMLDIDFFKKVNDNHGHDVGDKVLIDISTLLKKMVRANDIPCRFGGEEFIVLLPETSIKNAEKLAGRIRAKIEKTIMGGINITVSIGVSSLEITSSNSSDQLLKLADTELYRAKESGRNQVCVSKGAQ